MARLDGSQRGVLITEESARRIARAVQRIANVKRDQPGRKFRVGYDDDGGQVQIGKTTEKWAKGTTTELELILENSCDEGSEGSGSGGNTLEAHNLAYDVGEGVRCIVAEATNGCWYLVEAESCPDDGSGSGDCDCVAIGGQDLTELPGYDAAKTQILAHEEGCLKWLDTTECEDEE
jgi:hypothetical protein